MSPVRFWPSMVDAALAGDRYRTTIAMSQLDGHNLHGMGGLIEALP